MGMIWASESLALVFLLTLLVKESEGKYGKEDVNKDDGSHKENKLSTSIIEI